MIADPAPGYYDYLPHDLPHFVAEAEWGIDGAVFGQLAAGADPGIFLPVDEALAGKWVRARKLRRKEHSHGRRSEALAGVLDSAWKARTGKAPLPEYWNLELARARVEPERLASVVASLDDLASRWFKPQVGGSLTLEWPRPERRMNTGRPLAPVVWRQRLPEPSAADSGGDFPTVIKRSVRNVTTSARAAERRRA